MTEQDLLGGDHMALPRDYTGQACSLARSLEVIGERWTLLIVRDAFFGVRRFSDFLAHLSIPRAVLTERLAGLAAAGILERVPGPGGYDEYAITDKGQALWPAVHALMAWGDTYYAERGPRRLFTHTACGATVATAGTCPTCGAAVGPADLTVNPGPGLAGEDPANPVSVALSQPHRMLEPLVTRPGRTASPA
jgi:DNA-binding HxlR family transcriptional regulator